MRFKLDENFGTSGAERLRAAGHEVATVVEQSLTGADDHTLIGAARSEKRCLITFDLDFANPLLFNPREYSGIVVVRLSKPATLAEIALGIDTLIRGVQLGLVAGKLWIVDRGMLREYQPQE